MYGVIARYEYKTIDMESLVGEDDYSITNISLGLSYAFKISNCCNFVSLLFVIIISPNIRFPLIVVIVV